MTRRPPSHEFATVPATAGRAPWAPWAGWRRRVISQDQRRPTLALAALVALALVVRIGLTLAGPEHRPVLDGADYDGLARSLLAGHGYAFGSYVTAFRPPGYAFFLAGVYGLTGGAPRDPARAADTVQLAQALLGALDVALLAAIARPIWGRRTALAAAGLGAVYVPFLELGESFVADALALPLVLAALACVIRASPRRRDPAGTRVQLGAALPPASLRWAAGAGLSLGSLTLTRPNAALVAVPLALALWRPRAPGRSRRLKAPVVMLILAAAVLTPWTVRNAIALDAFVPVSTEAGETLAGTYNDVSRHDRADPAAWRIPRDIPPYAAVFRARVRMTEAGRDGRLTALALDYATRNPTYVGEVVGDNAVRMLELAGRRRWRFTAATIGIDAATADVGVVAFWLVAVLALIGACCAEARRAPRWLWACPALVLGATLPMTMETPRFRAEVDPFILLLAAVALASGPGRWRPARRAPV